MPPSAREDVHALLSAAFNTAMEILAQEGQSRPFGVLLDFDGGTLIRHIRRAEGASDDDLLRIVGQSIYEVADQLQAALLVQHTGDHNFPTVRGYGDHREATGFAFFVNWRPNRGRGPITVADIFVQPSITSLFR
jgi:hypothetical protein